MMILGIIGLVVLGVILGAAVNNKEAECPLHWDYDIKSGKLSALETRVSMLEQENNRLNYIYRSMEMKKRCFEESYAAHCRYCSKTFYAPTPEEQEVADMLGKITLTSKEIAEKLGYKLPL